MAVTFVSESASSGVAGGDVTVTKPAGLAVGDLMLAIGVTTAAQTITPPGTWSTHPQSISTARPLFYRVADAADVAAANFLFVTSGAATGAVAICAYRGVDPVTPLAGTAGSVSTGSTTLTITAANPSVAATLVQLVIKLNLATWTPPGTVSPERWDHTIAGVGSTAGGHETVPSGSTGTRAWVASAGAASGVGYAVPVREATQTVTPSGFDLAVDFGTPTLVPNQFLSVTGFDLAVDFGTPAVIPDQFVTVTGFDLTVDFGTPAVIPDQQVTVTGFDLNVEFGTPTLQSTVTPDGFDLPILFGAPTVIPDQQIAVDGFDLPILFGDPTLAAVVSVTGFDLTVEFGTPAVISDDVLAVTGFDLTVTFGTVTLAGQPFVTATVFDHETGLPVGAGAVVQLFDADGTLIDTTVTEADGSYIFHLPQGFTDDVFTVVRVTIDATEYQGVSELCPVQT